MALAADGGLRERFCSNQSINQENSMRHALLIAAVVMASAFAAPVEAQEYGAAGSGAIDGVSPLEDQETCLERINIFARNWFRTQFTPTLTCTGSAPYAWKNYQCSNNTKWYQVTLIQNTSGGAYPNFCTTYRRATAPNGSSFTFDCNRNNGQMECQ